MAEIMIYLPDLSYQRHSFDSYKTECRQPRSASLVEVLLCSPPCNSEAFGAESAWWQWGNETCISVLQRKVQPCEGGPCPSYRSRSRSYYSSPA
jgi:hypothetical protein